MSQSGSDGAIGLVAEPLCFEPIVKPKVWGGRRLAALGKPLPAEGTFGESWEIADLASTSASGGGGGEARSVVSSGRHAGRALAELIASDPAGVLGERGMLASSRLGGGFPLLVKYLDAREHLSVQVHPSPAYAAEHDGAHLKTESWYVVAAEPDASGNPPVIFRGVRPGTTREAFNAAIASGTVVEHLVSVPAVVGECHTLPSGTVHALGAGVLVAELQTPSDTTFRVYDWVSEYGRAARELHVEPALACIDFDSGDAGEPGRSGAGVLAETEHYRVTEARGHCEQIALAPLCLSAGDSCVVLMVVRSMGVGLASRSGAFDEVMLEAGRTVLLPASIVADCVIRAGPGTVVLVTEIGSPAGSSRAR